MGHLLIAEKLAHPFRPIVGGKDEFGSGRGRRPRDSPGIRMEHGHDWQSDGALRQTHDVRGYFRERMEHRRAMLVDDPLGVSGRSAGIAKPDRIALVAVGPNVI